MKFGFLKKESEGEAYWPVTAGWSPGTSSLFSLTSPEALVYLYSSATYPMALTSVTCSTCSGLDMRSQAAAFHASWW